MLKLLQGKRAVVVGGAGRIGSAVTQAFFRHGARVLVVDRNEEAIRRITEELPAGDQALCHPCCLEMDHEGSADELVKIVAERLDWTDILVNCLGYIYRAPFTAHSMAETDKLMRLNFSIPFAVCQKIASMMVKRGSGKIINFSSVGGLRFEKEHSGYCAAKAALIALSKVMALELSPQHIQINVVAPGPTETVPFKSPFYSEHPEALKAIEAVTGRIGHPDDHTGLVVFLASDQSDWITGQVIASDGGWGLV
jgi:NAD(P)-dependent dehydrogenase (short-subunit alcohol dehydrogenase family)